MLQIIYHQTPVVLLVMLLCGLPHSIEGKTQLLGPGRVMDGLRGQKTWIQFGKRDGLPGGAINKILQGKDGHLWFATYSGAARFDGEQFDLFTQNQGLVDDRLVDVLEDRDGNMWFATDSQGVSRFDGKNWVHFTEALGHSWLHCLYQDREGNIWFGTKGGLSRFDGQSWTTFTEEDGLSTNQVMSILQDKKGNFWFGTWGGGVSIFDGKTWQVYTQEHGLGNNLVWDILEDSLGRIWLATDGGLNLITEKKWYTFTDIHGLPATKVLQVFQDKAGNIWVGTDKGLGRLDVSKITEDPETYKFSTEDGLLGMSICAIAQDREDHIWIGDWTGNTARLDPNLITYHPTKGLGSDFIRCILQDKKGHYWFGGSEGNVTQFDGDIYTVFNEQDGLPKQDILTIYQDTDENIWFGTDGGAYKFDGKNLHIFTMEDGLGDNRVHSIFEDALGNIWMGTWGGGLTRYDGQKMETYTKDHGLTSNRFHAKAMVSDSSGTLWIATRGGGISLYDGQSFQPAPDGYQVNKNVNMIFSGHDQSLWAATTGGVFKLSAQAPIKLTTAQGLANNWVWEGMQDQDGQFWFSTGGGGIGRYDGDLLQQLTQQDGLPSNDVRTVMQDREGVFWIGSREGFSRYTPSKSSAPLIRVHAVIADQRYDNPSDLTVPSSARLISFEFGGISFKTRSGGLVYKYRLNGYDQQWHTTNQRQAAYPELSIGTYTFEVQVIDRDLVYSAMPATVRLQIKTPYHIVVLWTSMGVSILIIICVSTYAVRKRYQLRQAERGLLLALEEELQTAHDLQMGLMPTSKLQIQGLDLEGRCIPANHVGGDYFQYFQYQNKLALTMADVTGHAMEAAIPVVMFSGILESQIELGGSLIDLLERLNHTLTRKLTGRTFVCFAMAELNLETLSLLFTNGACPYPYHYRKKTDQVIEIEMDAYPLGLRNDTEYEEIEIQLFQGDYLVFCSDGIAEATDEGEEFFGYDRLQQTIHDACQQGLSAEAVIDQIVQTVQKFVGSAPQRDDMTCMVLLINEAPDSVIEASPI